MMFIIKINWLSFGIKRLNNTEQVISAIVINNKSTGHESQPDFVTL